MERAKIQKSICIRKITQHEEKFFQLPFKGMIRFDLNMEHDEVYGKFAIILTVCICSILYFCKKIVDCKKIDSASLFTRGIIKNIIIIKLFQFLRKLKMERANCFHEYL